MIWDSLLWKCEHIVIGNYFLLARLEQRSSQISFTCLGVYGPPSRDGRRAFFEELANTLEGADDNFIIEGDFNVTRSDVERKNCVGCATDYSLFSSLIHDGELLDLPIEGKAFTWTNNRQHPSLACLDRVLISFSTSLALPLPGVLGGERRLSDHNALIFQSGLVNVRKQKPFRLENFWLSKDDFKGLIQAVWNEHSPSLSAASIWLSRWRKLRKLIPLWAVNYKECSERKIYLEAEIEALNSRADSIGLSGSELEALRGKRAELDAFYHDECAYWHQRAKQRWLKEGDHNSRLFHQWASVRKRNNWIHNITTEAGIQSSDENIAQGFQKAYVDLLGSSRRPLLQLDWSRLELPSLVHSEGMTRLETSFEQQFVAANWIRHWINLRKVISQWSYSLKKSYNGARRRLEEAVENLDDKVEQMGLDEWELLLLKEHMRSAVFEMGSFKALGPDNLPPEFFRTYWDVIHHEVVANVTNFRPISSENSIIRIFSKLLAKRLKSFMVDLITKNQHTFIKGKSTLDCFTGVHEIV
ncbi:transposon protein [Canna indica]|uniref:Transposon protein n=1 Tax=Canna indica TaxID=4628 RepID=A0AAQ3JTI9_9LILI|nr:transposon protein [Canna indica]